MFLAMRSTQGGMGRPCARIFSIIAAPGPLGLSSSSVAAAADATTSAAAPGAPVLGAAGRAATALVSSGFLLLAPAFLPGPPFLGFFSGGASRATPTCAPLSAPMSLVPSPHISACRPTDRSVLTTSSFCSGVTRANTCGGVNNSIFYGQG